MFLVASSPSQLVAVAVAAVGFAAVAVVDVAPSVVVVAGSVAGSATVENTGLEVGLGCSCSHFHYQHVCQVLGCPFHP